MNDFEQKELDEKIMNEIRNKSEDIEIPESLSPENMMKRIQENKNKPNKFGRRVRIATSVLAASLALVVGISATKGLIKKNGNSTGADTNNIIAEGNKVESFSSYEEIYEILEEQSLYRKDMYVDNIFLEGDIAFNDSEVLGESKDESVSESVGGSNSSEEYTDTNIQVEGVDEADIVKTDGENIFVFDYTENCLRIIKADGADTKIATEIEDVVDTKEMTEETFIRGEMYLHDDKLVLVCSYGAYWYDKTQIITYDVSDINNPKKEGKINQNGMMDSSRMVDGILYVFTNEDIYYNDDDCKHIPEINNEKIKCVDIYRCGNNYYDSYTTLFSIDVDRPNKVLDAKSVLSNSSYLYVSKDNIYIFGRGEKEKGNYVHETTNILKIQYENGHFKPSVSGEVDGEIRDQFSMDEYDGTLRVLTTSESYRNYRDVTIMEEFVGEIAEEVFVEDFSGTKNNVFVLDENLNVIGSITGLAKGERIYSARFEGEMGYFVTFRETDPVFAVDFSDKTNPKILGELKVSGFSEYLHMWSDNLMIGLGEEVDEVTGERLGIKLSMFDVSDPENMKEVNKIIIDGYHSEALYNHKALLINPEKNIIGFATQDYFWDDYDEYQTSMDYYIFSYDNEAGFVQVEKAVEVFDDYDFSNNRYRGIHIGDYVYIVSTRKGVSVFDLKNEKILVSLAY